MVNCWFYISLIHFFTQFLFILQREQLILNSASQLFHKFGIETQQIVSLWTSGAVDAPTLSPGCVFPLKKTPSFQRGTKKHFTFQLPPAPSPLPSSSSFQGEERKRWAAFHSHAAAPPSHSSRYHCSDHFYA